MSGIHLDQADYCNITNINTSNNHFGIDLDSSNNNTIINNKVSDNNHYGICLFYSFNNSITNNIVLNNYEGLSVYGSSSNNTLTNNNASSNNYGIRFDESSNNLIYLNTFINNSDNVAPSCSTNIWNSTEKITYNYSGSTVTNYLGNHWDDYSDVDGDNDGI